MNSSLKMLIALVAVTFAATGCLADQPAASVSDSSSPPLTANLPDAPDFDLVSLSGGTINSSDLAGKVVVLDFWATWCAPCVEEIPNYNTLHHEQNPDEFAMLGIAVESGPIEDVEPYISEYGIEYPVVMGDNGIISDFGGVNAYPMTFVISPDWKVFKKYIGQFPPNKKEQIEQDVVELTSAFSEMKLTQVE